MVYNEKSADYPIEGRAGVRVGEEKFWNTARAHNKIMTVLKKNDKKSVTVRKTEEKKNGKRQRPEKRASRCISSTRGGSFASFVPS